MKRVWLIPLFIAFVPSSSWAQSSPIAVSYSVSGVSSDGTTTTLDLTLTVTNNGTGDISQVSVMLPGPTGDDTVIQGEIDFAAIAAGQLQTAAGQFLAPQDLYEGSSLDVLTWKIEYLDAQSVNQTVMILGHKQP